MAESFKVTAGAVVVKMAEGGEQMLLRGALISGSTYRVGDVERLARIGLIEAVKAPDTKTGGQAKAATQSTTTKK